MKPLEVLFQDEHLVAVNKPSGLLVHRSDIDRHETRYAMQVLRDQLEQWVYPIHRLDKATSGVLLFALDQETARRMSVLFMQHKIVKTYLAIVRGFTSEADRVEHALKESGRSLAGKRPVPERPAQDAVTDYRRIGTIELPHPVGRYATARYSLITASPLTGRSHQIRRHMKHIFHPVIGDTTYGDGRQNDFFRRQFDCQRLLLHAQRIQFRHPVTEQPINVVAPLDRFFSDLLTRLHWENIPFLK